MGKIRIWWHCLRIENPLNFKDRFEVEDAVREYSLTRTELVKLYRDLKINRRFWKCIFNKRLCLTIKDSTASNTARTQNSINEYLDLNDPLAPPWTAKCALILSSLALLLSAYTLFHH